MRTRVEVLAAIVLVAACSGSSTDATTATHAPTPAATATPTTVATTPPTTGATPTSTAPPATIAVAADPITGSIFGVEVYEDLSVQHADGDVDYDIRPPVGGQHAGQWVACGFYDEEVVEEEAVHSLEHGAVWVTYDEDALSESDIDTLAGLTEATFPEGSPQAAYVLVSPYPEMPAPVVASAWGRQLLLEGVEDERLRLFLLHFASGPQTPEPGAPC